MFSVCYFSTSRFLATDFNAETITVSLHHTLQISLCYSIHKDLSSRLDFQLSTGISRFLHHLPTSNSGNLNPILCCNCQLSRCISSRLSSQSSTLDCQLSTDYLNYFSWPGILVIEPRDGPSRKHNFLKITLLLLAYFLGWERIYQVVA
jgi:hypothetical protein